MTPSVLVDWNSVNVAKSQHKITLALTLSRGIYSISHSVFFNRQQIEILIRHLWRGKGGLYNRNANHSLGSSENKIYTHVSHCDKSKCLLCNRSCDKTTVLHPYCSTNDMRVIISLKSGKAWTPSRKLDSGPLCAEHGFIQHSKISGKAEKVINSWQTFGFSQKEKQKRPRRRLKIILNRIM